MSPIILPIIALAIDAIRDLLAGRELDAAGKLERAAADARASDIAHNALNAELEAALSRGGEVRPGDADARIEGEARRDL